MIKKNILFLLLIFISCSNFSISEKNDIYKYVPKGTKLTLEILKKGNSIINYSDGYVIIADLNKFNSENSYNPHLLFFNKKGIMYSSSYFPSEFFYSFKKNTLIIYLNEYRHQRTDCFRNDIPSKFKIQFIKTLDDKFRINENLVGGNIEKIKYNNKTKNVIILFKSNDDLTLRRINVPLYKIVYNYNDSEITINTVLNNTDKYIRILKINDLKLLDNFLNSVCR